MSNNIVSSDLNSASMMRITDSTMATLIGGCLLAIVFLEPTLTGSIWANHTLVKWATAGFSSGLLLLLTLWKLPFKPLLSLHISWIKSFFLLLFVLGGVSIFWSVNTDFTISKWLLWIIGFCTYTTAYHCQPGHHLVYRLSWGLFICAGLVAVIGVMQYFFGDVLFTQFSPPASTFGNKNIATHFIVLTLPISLYLLSKQHTGFFKIWFITLTMAVIMAYITYTQPRSSWVAIVVQISLIGSFLYVCRHSLYQCIYWHQSKTIAGWVSFGVFLLLINLSPSGWKFFFSSALERLNSVSSVNTRLDIWDLALTMFLDNPFWGSGLGSWYHNLIQEGYGDVKIINALRVHNDVLELGSELGLVGIVLLLSGALTTTVAIFFILKNYMLKTVNQPFSKIDYEQANLAWFYFLLWVALAGSFVQMQFTFPYQKSVPLFILGLYLGLIARYSDGFVPAIRIITFTITKRWYWLGSGLIFVFVLSIFAVYVDWIRSNYLISRMLSNQTIDQVSLSEPYIQPNYYQFELRSLSSLDNINHSIVRVIEEHALSYWPNNIQALEKLLNALLKLNNYDKAWEVIQQLRSFDYIDYYIDDFAELSIYQKTGEEQKFIDTFMNLLQQDEALLAARAITYRHLLRLSLQDPKLIQFSQYLYNKSVQYYGYDCHTEQSIAEYYWVTGAYAKAAKHIAHINRSHDKLCLRLVWGELFEQNRLAILLDQAKFSSND